MCAVEVIKPRCFMRPEAWGIEASLAHQRIPFTSREDKIEKDADEVILQYQCELQIPIYLLHLFMVTTCGSSSLIHRLITNRKSYRRSKNKGLSAIGPNFSIAAAFGNVHGVYKPGNVKLHPELLGKHQALVSSKLGCKTKPL